MCCFHFELHCVSRQARPVTRIIMIILLDEMTAFGCYQYMLCDKEQLIHSTDFLNKFLRPSFRLCMMKITDAYVYIFYQSSLFKFRLFSVWQKQRVFVQGHLSLFENISSIAQTRLYELSIREQARKNISKFSRKKILYDRFGNLILDQQIGFPSVCIYCNAIHICLYYYYSYIDLYIE